MAPQEQDLRQGAIVWIEVPDPRGHLKRRPVVVITPSDEIVLDGEVVGVAVTTSVGEKPPPSFVLMPWTPQGHPATGFRRPCAAVCNWLVGFRPSDVGSIEGYVPRKLLTVLVRRVQESASDGPE